MDPGRPTTTQVLRALGLDHLRPQGSGDQDDKSRMTGDCHVRICEGRGVKFPPATRRAKQGTACGLNNHDRSPTVTTEELNLRLAQ